MEAHLIFLTDTLRSLSARSANHSFVDFENHSGSESDDSNSMPVERNESRISIIELTEISVRFAQRYFDCL